MSRTSTFRGGFVVTLPLSDSTATLDWREFRLHQEVRKHDLLILTVRSRSTEYFDTLYPNTPIQVTYRDSDGMTAMFMGYISKVAPVFHVEDSHYEREVTCIAASREFRVTARNTWRNRTAPEIAQDIGDRLGFKVITKQHGLRKKQVVQGGDTYWETLTKLAKMTGYVLRAEGTTLYFLPLKEMVKAFSSAAPVLATASVSSQYATTALDVDTLLGNTSDDDDDLSDTAVVVSLGPNDTEPVAVREAPSSAIRSSKASTPSYEKYNPSVIAHSRADAQLLAKGMADQGMMAYDGRVFGKGDPFIAPYRPVYLATNDKTATGYWIVKSVTHRIAHGEYTCETIISTDEVSPQRAVPPATRYRNLSQEAQQGWSPMSVSASRLKILSPSFVVGMTYRPDGKVAQWVAV
jgi:phage protein D